MFIAAAAVLAANAWLRIDREVDLLRRDLRVDQARIGRMLAAAATHAADSGGDPAVAALMHDTDQASPEISVRRVRPRGPAASGRGSIPRSGSTGSKTGSPRW